MDDIPLCKVKNDNKVKLVKAYAQCHASEK